MRELERKALVLAKKTDSDMAKMGRDDALRDLAAEKVRTYVRIISDVLYCSKVSQKEQIEKIKSGSKVWKM